MLNQFVLVGRITKDIEIKKLENGKKVGDLIVAVPRSYKNADGNYDTDYINCRLFNGIAENIFEYCKKGDMVGVKGRLESDENGVIVLAEKVTFLNSKTKEDDK